MQRVSVADKRRRRLGIPRSIMSNIWRTQRYWLSSQGQGRLAPVHTVELDTYGW